MKNIELPCEGYETCCECGEELKVKNAINFCSVCGAVALACNSCVATSNSYSWDCSCDSSVPIKFPKGFLGWQHRVDYALGPKDLRNALSYLDRGSELLFLGYMTRTYFKKAAHEYNKLHVNAVFDEYVEAAQKYLLAVEEEMFAKLEKLAQDGIDCSADGKATELTDGDYSFGEFC